MQWDLKHITSSPGYAQLHGMSERAVQTVKKILKKAVQSHRDPSYLSLLEYRNTPMDGQLESPAKLLMGRRLKSILPVSHELLKPKGHSTIALYY